MNKKFTPLLVNTFLSESSEEKRYFARVQSVEASLPAGGINCGDGVMVRPSKSIAENEICLWQTPDGNFFRFGYVNFGDVSLDDKAGNIRRYRMKDIALVGVVEFVLKPPQTVGASV